MASSPEAFRFIHCADLHLDSPFVGICDVDSRIAKVLQESTFRSFERIVSLAIEHQVDFIVIAGDVYDSADHSLRAQIRFRDTLKRAADAGIESFIIHGNHDPLDRWDAGVELPEGAHRFGGDSVERITATRTGVPLADVYGISFPTREVKENLALRFERTGDAPFAIGVLHCNLGGDARHDNYAPCSLDELARSGMDYWALGHVHTRAVAKASNPCVIYPGNIQGRSVRETGERGCYLVRVGEDRSVEPEFIATDEVRWFGPDEATLKLEAIDSLDRLLSELEELREVLRQKAQGHAAIARVRLAGRSDLHARLRSLDVERDLLGPLREDEDRADFMWIESIQIETQPAIDIEQRREVEDFVGDFLRAAEVLRSDSLLDGVRDILLGREEGSKVKSAVEKFSTEELLETLHEAELLGLDYLLRDEG